MEAPRWPIGDSSHSDLPFVIVRYIFDFLSFAMQNLLSFLKNTVISLGDLFSIFGISGPEDVVLWLLSMSSVVFILSKLGWLPARIDRAINRNQRAEISTALELIGVKEEEVRARFRSLKFQGVHSKDSISNRANVIVKNHESRKKVFVGHTNPAEGDSFVDLMGGSTVPAKAAQMASLLKAHIGTSSDVQLTNITDFDYVATPKSGSPFIGYEFSRITDKPLMLHSQEPKYKGADGSSEPLAHFDLNFEPKKGMSVLIVDDSSTGGRKVLKLIQDLKKLDLKVKYCAVIFEPQSKVGTQQNASKALSEQGVQLISIIKYP